MSGPHPSPRRAIGLGAGAFLILALAILAGAAIGETAIAPQIVLKVIANHLWDAGWPVEPIDDGIIWAYRVARALVGACCGAALGLSGLVLQSLLRNALADPYLLGVSAGASTGAVAVTLLGVGAGAISLSLGAFAGALLAFALVAGLAYAAGGMRGRATGQIILAGVAGAQLFNALTAFFIAKSANANEAHAIMFWLMGNLSGVRWPDVWLAAPVSLACALLIALHARALDAFAFGAESAAALGVSVHRARAALIGAATLATAVMVSILGAIGFVGLVIPHAARFLVGPRHGRLIPATALIGAVFLIAADIASRILIPGQVLPIGVVTALVGAPAFAVILIRGQRGRR